MAKRLRRTGERGFFPSINIWRGLWGFKHLETAFGFGPEHGGGEVLALAGGGHFVKGLEDGEIGFGGTERKFAAEVFAEGFGGDADNLGDAVLRDAAAGEEAREATVFFGGVERGTAVRFARGRLHG